MSSNTLLNCLLVRIQSSYHSFSAVLFWKSNFCLSDLSRMLVLSVWSDQTETLLGFFPESEERQILASTRIWSISADANSQSNRLMRSYRGYRDVFFTARRRQRQNWTHSHNTNQRIKYKKWEHVKTAGNIHSITRDASRNKKIKSSLCFP